jgi:hypothetical protein
LRIELTTCSFDDVVRELDRAQTAYDQKAQGIRGFMRKTVRSMGDNADALSLWLDIIPPDHGLSILGAGLTIIFWVGFPLHLVFPLPPTQTDLK